MKGARKLRETLAQSAQCPGGSVCDPAAHARLQSATIVWADEAPNAVDAGMYNTQIKIPVALTDPLIENLMRRSIRKTLKQALYRTTGLTITPARVQTALKSANQILQTAVDDFLAHEGNAEKIEQSVKQMSSAAHNKLNSAHMREEMTFDTALRIAPTTQHGWEELRRSAPWIVRLAIRGKIDTTSTPDLWVTHAAKLAAQRMGWKKLSNTDDMVETVNRSAHAWGTTRALPPLAEMWACAEHGITLDTTDLWGAALIEAAVGNDAKKTEDAAQHGHRIKERAKRVINDLEATIKRKAINNITKRQGAGTAQATELLTHIETAWNECDELVALTRKSRVRINVRGEEAQWQVPISDAVRLCASRPAKTVDAALTRGRGQTQGHEHAMELEAQWVRASGLRIAITSQAIGLAYRTKTAKQAEQLVQTAGLVGCAVRKGWEQMRGCRG